MSASGMEVSVSAEVFVLSNGGFKVGGGFVIFACAIAIGTLCLFEDSIWNVKI